MSTILTLVAVASLMQPVAAGGSPRQRISLDDGWRFHLGHGCDPVRDFGFGSGQPWAKAAEAVGAVRLDFDDSDWREVNLPHDWVVELDFSLGGSPEHMAHGFKPVGRAYPETTVGWYRRQFDIPKDDLGKRISIDFDGVFRDCHIWLNGHLVGRNESGYVGFNVDVTDAVNYGGENMLVVRADASHYEGWFYEGGGIYRHVWLMKTDPVHIPQWGVFVSSRIGKGGATVTVETTIVNDSADQAVVKLESQILDATGTIVGEAELGDITIRPRLLAKAIPEIVIATPGLWSLDRPDLYRLRSTVRAGSRLVDQYETRFGIRTAAFDKDKGFFLNGEPVKIKGVCCHQDHAGVGSALPDRLQYFRIQKLKEMGVNAYRCSHNPPTPELLEACDRLGMLVMDEQRLVGSSTEILGQVRRLVLRDRNHPSVILWSIGNEEPIQGSPAGKRIAESMIRTIKQLDPTRPVTYACNGGNVYEGINEVVDIRGFNYFNISDIDKYRAEHPGQVLIGTEEASTVSTRGEYFADKDRGYLSAYDRHKPGWGALAEEWMKFYMTRPFLAGGFAWTGFDYRGEPTPYGWPCINSHFGIMDTCGFPKDLYHYYKAWWTDEPVLHLLPHWNWPGKEGQPIDVWCFTNMDRVQLLLNGKDLGEKTVEQYGHAEWSVPYEPGVLEAVGFKDGNEAMRTRVATTGQPVKLLLTPDRNEIASDGKDVCVLSVSVRDAQGQIVPTAGNDVFFEIDGPGVIIGVGNGDPSSHERDRFIPRAISQKIENWMMAPANGFADAAPTPAELQAAGGTAVDVSRAANSIPAEDGFATYWTRFTVSEGDLRAGLTRLSIGQIDDHGRVLLNGTSLGETHDWERSHGFDAARLLKVGENDLVIMVKNDRGPGGLGRGVRLTGGIERPRVHRRLFNGLCQVIVQSTPASGVIRLRAKAEGLESAVAEVRTTRAD
jgi:beta-galactosidase